MNKQPALIISVLHIIDYIISHPILDGLGWIVFEMVPHQGHSKCCAGSWYGNMLISLYQAYTGTIDEGLIN